MTEPLSAPTALHSCCFVPTLNCALSKHLTYSKPQGTVSLIQAAVHCATLLNGFAAVAVVVVVAAVSECCSCELSLDELDAVEVAALDCGNHSSHAALHSGLLSLYVSSV
jgi:hypothetical protein